ncbi:hypothetical protein B0H16DRAFT_592751 [Mycena metata]|uniref:Oligopeptide transporter n=1 Tax=Mycena metata TaxID=1033252 RepID=A0AAD7JCJ0_9AGAR|nr:hypothetical protein B0H16DRAFT_592751 [Mycena metata]
MPADAHSASSKHDGLERDSASLHSGSHDPEKGAALPVPRFDDPNLPAFDDPNLPAFDDPNLPSPHSPDANATALFDDDSPYPEVRSAVANTDDPAIPVATLRAWTLGILWAILIPGLNQFFFFRYPAVTVTSIVPQLLTFPLGRLWARLLPNVTLNLFGVRVELNGGAFSIKVCSVLCFKFGAVGCLKPDARAPRRFVLCVGAGAYAGGSAPPVFFPCLALALASKEAGRTRSASRESRRGRECSGVADSGAGCAS